ncbi:TolB family protein [Stenotrophomonas sp. PSU-St15]
MMRITPTLLVLAASLLSAPVAMALNEYGIEGMGVVSTRADEARGTISADGQRIVFARRGEGGWGLWQARLIDGRWQQAQALAVDVSGEARDPYFSRDGRWLLFAAGTGGQLALYRAAVTGDGQLGNAQALRGERGRYEERGPALSMDGRRLLFARQQGRGAGWDLFVATLDAEGVRGPATALAALNSADDETDADWLGNDGAVVFSRGSGTSAQVWSTGCAWSGVALQPLGLSFNQAGGWTGAPVIDNAKPGEMLVASSAAKAPRAGGVDLYRLAVPKVPAVAGCMR